MGLLRVTLFLSYQIPERLMMTLELLKKELAVAALQQKLGKEVCWVKGHCTKETPLCMTPRLKRR